MLRVLMLLALLLWPAGCGAPRVRVDEGAREYVPSDYEAVLRLWTREREVLSIAHMDSVLNVTATFESWDFRWAYSVRYADDYRLTVAERESLLERALADTRVHHQFFVALQADRPEWADLTAPDTAWIVRLVDDSATETEPDAIERIQRPGAVVLTYFPYTSPWRAAFRIRFPATRPDGRPTIPPDAKWFALRFAGPQGADDLRWRLDER